MVFIGHILGCCYEISSFLGKSGVTLFYVLSAYLITDSYYNKKLIISWNWIRAFYQKRILRIYPSLIVVIAIFVIMGTISVRDAFCALFMCKDVGHLWFLRWLFLFYLIFPLVLYIMRILKKLFFGLLSCGWIGIVGYLIICSAHGKSINTFLWVLPCFMIGMILPAVVHWIENNEKNILNKSYADVYMLVLCICFQILGIAWYKGMEDCASENAKLYLNYFCEFLRFIGAAIIASGMIVAFRECDIIKQIAPKCRCIMCIGKYSYSIYLVHYFVIQFICGWGNLIGGRALASLYVVAIMLMTGMLSHLLYTYVERRFESR